MLAGSVVAVDGTLHEQGGSERPAADQQRVEEGSVEHARRRAESVLSQRERSTRQGNDNVAQYGACDDAVERKCIAGCGGMRPQRSEQATDNQCQPRAHQGGAEGCGREIPRERPGERELQHRGEKRTNGAGAVMQGVVQGPESETLHDAEDDVGRDGFGVSGIPRRCSAGWRPCFHLSLRILAGLLGLIPSDCSHKLDDLPPARASAVNRRAPGWDAALMAFRNVTARYARNDGR